MTFILPSIDPRRSLMAGVIWLIIALATTFSIAAALMVGGLARANILQQHVRRLALETDQLASDLDQALTSRLDAIRFVGPTGGLRMVFEELRTDYPQFDWIAIADTSGSIAASSGGLQDAKQVADEPWFIAGMQHTWVGMIAPAPTSESSLGDMAAPVHDAAGRIVGVITAHLRWHRGPTSAGRLTDDPDLGRAAQAIVLDRDQTVIVGPEPLRNHLWKGVVIHDPPPDASAGAPRFERLPDGRKILVARAGLTSEGVLSAPGWQVQLSEPEERVYQRGDALAIRIFYVSVGLGAGTVLLGALAARQLTRRLKRLTESVEQVGQGQVRSIEVPPGRDEVAKLGGAFAGILSDLDKERSELKSMGSELERRVEIRTREVERLAEESRYSSMVRERLKIARDLHDTLAHSMMAMLSEIRLLRKLQLRDPAAVPDELARAEEVAHEGIKEARNAISQMRGNSVRDTGLGAALARNFEQFLNHTGLTGDFSADPEAARFGDERAETLLRIAHEGLRNVQQHAQATHVKVALRNCGEAQLELCIEDNGIGFDPRSVPPGHYGILGLYEQAEVIDAAFTLESQPDQGTTLRVLVRTAPVAFETNG